MNEAEQSDGILAGITSLSTVSGNLALQELRRGLIDQAKGRANDVLEAASVKRHKPSIHFKAHVSLAMGSLKTACNCLDLLEQSPSISNAGFLKLLDLAERSIEYANGELMLGLAMHGAASGRRNGGFNKHKKDPKSTEREFVKECWKDWQASPLKYKGKAEFARDMLTKCEHLQSTKVIERWCCKWGKLPQES